MSHSPALNKRHQYSSDVAEDFDSDDDLSSTGGPQTASSREIRCASSLSELGQKFAHVKLGDYTRCETFVSHHPKILKEDLTDFLRVARAALLAGEKQLAKQCIQQSVLIRDLRDSRDSGRERYFRRLMAGRNSDSDFVKECNEALKKVEEKISVSLPASVVPTINADKSKVPHTSKVPRTTRHPSVGSIVSTGYIMSNETTPPNPIPIGYSIPNRFLTGGRYHHIDSLYSNLQTHRHEGSSRLSPLGHVFIRIPVNQSARCLEFLEKNPEILDEDHELYISEALSALRGGNESEAQSAIEKSIILRDFDRRRPEKGFPGLSQSVSSAMAILRRRAETERTDDLPGRMQTSVLRRPDIGPILSYPSDRRGERPLSNSRAPHAPRAGEGDRSPSVGGFLQTRHGELPLVQVDDTSKETAALKTSILQLRKENEAAKQELQSTRKVLKDQKQKVASTKQGLEAAKQELQKIRKELAHEKQELTARLEELCSTREELQSREKELKGSKGQEQTLQLETKKLAAAKKFQLLRDDELRAMEKELNKTKMELDRERESLAQAKYEIEATRRPRDFEDAKLPLPATAELPETICMPIGIQTTMEDKATQTTAVDSFDDTAEFEMPRSENESDINGLRYGSTVFGLLQSAATVFKTGIQQQQGNVVFSSRNVPFSPNDDSTSFITTDYLLETDTSTPAGTEDEGEDEDARTLEGRWDRRRRRNEVIHGLKFRFKEVETREDDVEARELQVQFDQDKVKREREIQRKRDRAAFARQCHGCGIVLALGFEFPE